MEGAVGGEGEPWLSQQVPPPLSPSRRCPRAEPRAPFVEMCSVPAGRWVWAMSTGSIPCAPGMSCERATALQQSAEAPSCPSGQAVHAARGHYNMHWEVLVLYPVVSLYFLKWCSAFQVLELGKLSSDSVPGPVEWKS